MHKEIKYTAIIAVATTVAFIGCLICLAFIYYQRAAAVGSNDVIKEVTVIADRYDNTEKENDGTETAEYYTVKEYFGKIGVFDDDGRLLRLIEVYTKTLPKADRILLREGIRISSKEALEALIEDYSS